ncbi:MAG TPA: THUMP domain-containing protein [Candidatus Latescibacteria bacterium]|nr:SAM-dependent methyltransferase [Gemmatimonadaceae bacterium]MDP6018178.1 THUMP domain-containing protein [Candidatus Latescibacterota bacterium]HJP33610.1 THUMP domain-containing protein [Candidatus Latescibacterota bacterium]
MTWRARTGLLERLASHPDACEALWFTTNPGLEDVVADEFCERLAAIGIPAADLEVELKPLGFSGNIITWLPRVGTDIEAAALRLRSVHHVVRPMYGFDLSPNGEGDLDRIAAQLTLHGVPALEAGDGSFRITTRRSGNHPYGSMDVQQRAGATLVARYGLAVDLDEPDCEVRVDVIGAQCLVGIQLTGESLSRRKQRCFNPHGAIKSNVAYAMLRFARLSCGRILDPFCGSATIPIEAAQVFPDLEIVASDYSARAVDGARLNVTAAGLDQRIDVQHLDVADLAGIHSEASFDAIVTNPPFGVRLGRGMDFLAFYSRVLDAASHLLKPGGLLVFLAWKRGVIDRANHPHDHFRRNHVRVVETGGIFPRVYVMERRSVVDLTL